MEQRSVIASLPNCLEYHPNSELRKRPGYYPNLTAAQVQLVHEVNLRISLEAIDFFVDNETNFLKILRFLRARKFDLDLTMDMIREDVTWRKEQGRLNYHKMKVEESIHCPCPISKLLQYYPTWLQGFDKQGRPVSYRKFGFFETWNLIKFAPMSTLVDFHIWETEQAVRCLYSQSKKTGFNIETFTVVIDAAGFGFRMATNDAYSFVKALASTDSDHYPERLGTLVVVNAPFAVSVSWRVIQTFLDDSTRVKIRIFGCDEAEWRPVLLDLIDESQIPKAYGGSAPNMSMEEAILNMNHSHPHDDSEEQTSAETELVNEEDFKIEAVGGGARIHPEAHLDHHSAGASSNSDKDIAAPASAASASASASASAKCIDQEESYMPAYISLPSLIMPPPQSELESMTAAACTPDNTPATPSQYVSSKQKKSRPMRFVVDLLQCKAPVCDGFGDEADFDFVIESTAPVSVSTVSAGPAADFSKDHCERVSTTTEESCSSSSEGEKERRPDRDRKTEREPKVDTVTSSKKSSSSSRPRVPPTLFSPLEGPTDIYDIYNSGGRGSRGRNFVSPTDDSSSVGSQVKRAGGSDPSRKTVSGGSVDGSVVGSTAPRRGYNPDCDDDENNGGHTVKLSACSSCVIS